MDAHDLLSANTTASTASFPTAVVATVGQQTILEVMPFVKDGMDGGWFGMVSTSLILVFGTFGNVMTIVVLRRLRSGWSAMNMYLTALALSDTAMLYTGPLAMWTRKMFSYDLYASHVAMCKAGLWVMNTTASLSAWLLVALTLQRAASVVCPHRVSLLCTRRTSRVVIVVTSVICSLLYSHTLFGYDLVEVEAEVGVEVGVRAGGGVKNNKTLRRLCTFGDVRYQQFHVGVWVHLDMVLYSLLPCLFLLSGNAVLGWKLAVSVREAQERFSGGGGADSSSSSSRRKKASSTTVTILIISSVFVVLTVPLMAYNTLFQKYAAVSEKSRAFHYFLYDFFLVAGFSNFACNFYLYCLTGSRFRGEFLNIIRACCWRRPVTSQSCYVIEGDETLRVQKKQNSDSRDDF